MFRDLWKYWIKENYNRYFQYEGCGSRDEWSLPKVWLHLNKDTKLHSIALSQTINFLWVPENVFRNYYRKVIKKQMKTLNTLLLCLLGLCACNNLKPEINLCRAIPDESQYSMVNDVHKIKISVDFDKGSECACPEGNEIRVNCMEGLLAGTTLIKSGFVSVNGVTFSEAQNLFGNPYYYTCTMPIDYKITYNFVIKLTNGVRCSTSITIPDTLYYSSLLSFKY